MLDNRPSLHASRDKLLAVESGTALGSDRVAAVRTSEARLLGAYLTLESSLYLVAATQVGITYNSLGLSLPP